MTGRKQAAQNPPGTEPADTPSLPHHNWTPVPEPIVAENEPAMQSNTAPTGQPDAGHSKPRTETGRLADDHRQPENGDHTVPHKNQENTTRTVSDVPDIPAAELATWHTPSQASKELERLGISKSDRAIRRYCELGNLNCRKHQGAFGGGEQWSVEPVSLLKLADRTRAGQVPPNPIPQPTSPPSELEQPPSVPAGQLNPTQPVVPAPEVTIDIQSLVEVAKLEAQLEGKDQLIIELRSELGHIRNSFTEQLKRQEDVKEIASDMLDTMRDIATGRTLPPKQGRGEAEVVRYKQSDGSEQRMEGV